MMGIMVDEGRLDYDRKITEYWPEYGRNGKEWTRVKDLMKHEAGLQNFSKSYPLTTFHTKNIKNNSAGEIIENEANKFYTV